MKECISACQCASQFCMIGQLLSYYCIFRTTFIALRTMGGGGEGGGQG